MIELKGFGGLDYESLDLGIVGITEGGESGADLVVVLANKRALARQTRLEKTQRNLEICVDLDM
jgi:hypothetical protein